MEKNNIKRERKLLTTLCLLNEVCVKKKRSRKNKCRGNIEVLSVDSSVHNTFVCNNDECNYSNEKRHRQRLHVHSNAVRILANSLFVINAFCNNVPVGEYFMPKHSLKNGVIIAESVIKIRENLRGVTQYCPV